MSDKSSTRQGLVKKHRVVLFAVIVLGTGIAMTLISGHFLSIMLLCSNGSTQSPFPPGKVITASCPVVQDVGQELTFRAVFYGPTGAAAGETIKVPAHVQIRDPNNAVLYDRDIDDKIVISFMPEILGTYTATITNQEQGHSPSVKQGAMIEYALGFLVFYNDVPNPLGNAMNVMIVIGNVVYTAGIGVIIFGVIKATRKDKR